MPVGATVDLRMRVNVGVDPALRARLADLSCGRPLIIDYFASRRCGVVIGDLIVEFQQGPPNGSYVMVASIEGVEVFAENRLVPVFEDAALTLRLGGPVFARHLAVSLDPGSRWIEFLEQPNALAGKQRFSLPHILGARRTDG